MGWLPTALADLVHMGETEADVASSVFSLTGVIRPMFVPVMF